MRAAGGLRFGDDNHVIADARRAAERMAIPPRSTSLKRRAPACRRSRIPHIERRLPALMHDTIDLITRGGKKIPGDKLAQFSMEADQLSPERRRTDAPPEGTEV